MFGSPETIKNFHLLSLSPVLWATQTFDKSITSLIFSNTRNILLQIVTELCFRNIYNIGNHQPPHRILRFTETFFPCGAVDSAPLLDSTLFFVDTKFRSFLNGGFWLAPSGCGTQPFDWLAGSGIFRRQRPHSPSTLHPSGWIDESTLRPRCVFFFFTLALL